MSREGENQPVAAPAAPCLRPVAAIHEECMAMPVITLPAPAKQLGVFPTIRINRFMSSINDRPGSNKKLTLYELIVRLATNFSSTGEPMMGITMYCDVFRKAISIIMELIPSSDESSSCDVLNCIENLLKIIGLKKKNRSNESILFMNSIVMMIKVNASNDDMLDYLIKTLLFWKKSQRKRQYFQKIEDIRMFFGIVGGDPFIDDYIGLKSIVQNIMMMMVTRHFMRLDVFVFFIQKLIQIIQILLNSRALGENLDHFREWNMMILIIFSDGMDPLQEALIRYARRIILSYYSLRNQTGGMEAVIAVLTKIKTVLNESDPNVWTHHKLQEMICSHIIETHPLEQRRAILDMLIESGLLSTQYALLMNQRYPF
jgi:hypothetical protein